MQQQRTRTAGTTKPIHGKLFFSIQFHHYVHTRNKIKQIYEGIDLPCKRQEILEMCELIMQSITSQESPPLFIAKYAFKSERLGPSLPKNGEKKDPMQEASSLCR